VLKTLGFELQDIEPGRAVFEGMVAEALTQNGILHGGVLAAILDTACAVAAISQVFPDFYATSINLQVSFLRSIRQGRFRVEGRCIKTGRNVMFTEASVCNEAGQLLATGSSQLIVIPRSAANSSSGLYT
jgi:uncharacterized protein (TIGR00369 family)